MEIRKLDKDIYRKGIDGNLTISEIDKLPEEYDYLKSMFKHNTKLRMRQKMFMKADSKIVGDGFSGKLTHDEINRLPKEYDKFKDLFHEWTRFETHDNRLPRFDMMVREFKIARKIISASPNKGNWFSKYRRIFGLMKNLRDSRKIGSVYTEDDVTPQEEIDKMLVPSPGSAKDPDWAHKCAINNRIYCKMPIKTIKF